MPRSAQRRSRGDRQVRLRPRRLPFLGDDLRRLLACLASAVAGADRLDRSDGRRRYRTAGARRRRAARSWPSICCWRCCWDSRRPACSAGRCRAANGASSTSSWPTTRNPPSIVFSSDGPQGSAASSTINGRSIAVARRRRATFRASRSQSRRRCRMAASSDCFRNREGRDERCDHRLRLRQSAFGGKGVRARRRGAWKIRRRSW